MTRKKKKKLLTTLIPDAIMIAYLKNALMELFLIEFFIQRAAGGVSAV